MAADPRLSRAMVVGAFQSEYSKHSDQGIQPLLAETIASACRKLGLAPSDVDGLAVNSFLLSPDNVVTVAEYLGIQLKWAHQGAHGGAGGVVSLIAAAEAITANRASIVICAAADAFDTRTHMSMIGSFNTGMRDYLAPYGFGGTNGIFALVEDEHRNRYGTTREQLGKIAVTQRRHAQLNPNALLREPLSLDDYLEARVIAEPIRLYDCVLPCSGSDVVFLMSVDAARDRGFQGLEILGGEQRHNYRPHQALSVTTGLASFADDLFRESGVERKDLDFLQLYDDYPIMVLIQLEDLGLAEKGSGGAYILEHDFALTGDVPLNTGGGQLSCGQAGASGGMIGLYEATVQLLGLAGERQLKDPELGLVSGFGMVGYGRGLSSAAVVLRRSDGL